MWEAVLIDGRHGAEDLKTGAWMRVHGTPEIDLREVVVRLQGLDANDLRANEELTIHVRDNSDPSNPKI